ncbi:MAG: DUF2892 domain-containing protein [Solirubrobacteraceae bacterium]|nr:DUF2892 domain-containing protein [Solirubrobacteraceae bacterium]
MSPRTPSSVASAPQASASLTPASRWPLERALFALAGTATLLAALLAATVSPWFLLLTSFVGVSQWMYVTIGACPASVVLRRALGLEPGCPRAPR